MNIILFIVIFLYTSNWVRLLLFKEVFKNFKIKSVFSVFEDKRFLEKVNKKVGLKFIIKVQESPTIFGYMSGIPIMPIMVISRGAIKYLSKSELEWIVLHEAGHCVGWHVVKETIAQLLTLIFGLLLLPLLQLNIYIVPFYAVFVSILWYQIERCFELEADMFSLKRMDNPNGMITANQKMKEKSKSVYSCNHWLLLEY